MPQLFVYYRMRPCSREFVGWLPDGLLDFGKHIRGYDGLSRRQGGIATLQSAYAHARAGLEFDQKLLAILREGGRLNDASRHQQDFARLKVNDGWSLRGVQRSGQTTAQSSTR